MVVTHKTQSDSRSLAEANRPNDLEALLSPCFEFSDKEAAGRSMLNGSNNSNNDTNYNINNRNQAPSETMPNQSRMWVVARPLQLLTAVAALCIWAACVPHGFHARGRTVPTAAITADVLELQQSSECQDTPGWSNSWVNCVNERGGNRPELCTPGGWTCLAYEEKQWCVGGSGARFALGANLNYPENHCCACGGGHHQLPSGTLLPTLLPTPVPTQLPAPLATMPSVVLIEQDPNCRTTVYGEGCYETLEWAIREGIHSQPDQFPGLNPSSGLEEFQMLLHRTDSAKCPTPPCMINYQSYSTPTLRVMPKTTIKGIAYAPAPLKTVAMLHNDDFMALDAAPLWASWGRGDFQIMASLGVNTVRTYGNDPRANKRVFFDEAYKAGIGINAGMSDWPFLQSPSRCMLRDYYCFEQTYKSYRRNLLNGFTINNYTAYHPALKVFTIMNEPELKIYPRTLVCRALITALDAILQAELDVGVTGNPVAFTVTFSYATTSGPPALGQMMDLHRCIMNPQAAPTLYTPRNDILKAYRTRFVNSFNTFSPYFNVQSEFLNIYNRSGFWDHNLKMPVYIGEYHSVKFSLQEDLSQMQRIVPEYPFFMGFTFFEYQVRYDKGGSEEQFGMFGLGDCKLMDLHFLGKYYSVWDLTENKDPLSRRQEKISTIIATVFGGNIDVSRLNNPIC